MTFYVYLHIQADALVPFYIGKGERKRAFDFRYRSKFWKAVVNKHGVEVLILDEGLTEDEAHALERVYIRRLGRRDIGTGTLVNFTEGGEGTSGMVHTEETKRKIGQSNKGKVITPEHRARISVARKGKSLSSEHRAAISRNCNRNRDYANPVTRTKIKEALTGKSKSDAHRSRISEVAKNRAPMPSETRRKIAISNTGRLHTEETKAKIGAAHKGKIVSVETRAKLSAAALARKR